MLAPSFVKHIDSSIAAIIGFVVVYLFTRHSGVGVSPDAIMYISTARNIHDHGTLNFFNNQPIVDFPLGYPIFLGIIYLITGVDPIMTGTALDGILFGTLILLSGIIIQAYAPKAIIYKWLMLAAILLSQALLQVYTYLWSETLFTVWILVFFFAFNNYLDKRTVSALILAAFVAAISAVIRYAGVTVIATGGLILLFDDAIPLRKRWKAIIIYSIISCSLLIANLVRNRILSGNSTGPREKSITGFADNLSYFGATIANWLTLPELLKPANIITAAAVFIILFALLIYLLIKRKANKLVTLATAFAVVYGLFIVVSSTFSRYEQINNRLLSPMYISLFIALTWWIISVPVSWKPLLKWALYLPLIAIILWTEFRLYQIDYQRYDDQYDYGMPGYTDDSWKESGMINYLKSHRQFFKTDVPIYSDAYEAVYFFTGERTVKLLPHVYFDNDIDQFYQLPHYYLIWFKDLANPELIGLKDIRQKQNLKLVMHFNDGDIYQYDVPER
ncbi:hypothetical protein [Mucilaginibacter ginkgonis]|uniref:Dolichyl-phosphate-mannose-protein mannosyltransferase n=1 Tax=Mucilaginibacter ginkgonis TaxID=2682091 RepID=A0A6I4HVV0_9SPHI|nr:hypothetical protein [Mucilaginibacter ginkgonis]QQL51037.1 hypothetical protein GO620_006190 [Mucilaginibacter ginkgonis]